MRLRDKSTAVTCPHGNICTGSLSYRFSLLGGVMSRKGPDVVDQIVGRNIRIHRLQNGLTQTELADELDLTFQQVQKYE